MWVDKVQMCGATFFLNVEEITLEVSVYEINGAVGNFSSQACLIHEIEKLLRIWLYYVKVLMTFRKFISCMRILTG
jgi:hypothetical protein